jgi:alternate F1F0 ATPase F0 subunit B
MNINWFEIIVQIINFFILLFILQKLFYKPVIKAMEDRQQGIRDIRNEADKKKKEADTLIQKYESSIKTFEENKAEEMNKARKEADEKKESIIETYKKEAEAKRESYLNEVNEEKEFFLHELRSTLGKSSIIIASKILKTISEEELTEKIFDVFINKIKSLEKEKLEEEIKLDGEKIILISSAPLSDDQKNRFSEAISEKLDYSIEIGYEVDENLIMGFELNLESLTVHTNIENYLREAEDNIKKILDKKTS